MVTARELVILSGSFMFHSMSVRRLRHLCEHASHERYTVSNVEGREVNLHNPLPHKNLRILSSVGESLMK